MMNEHILRNAGIKSGDGSPQAKIVIFKIADVIPFIPPADAVNHRAARQQAKADQSRE